MWRTNKTATLLFGGSPGKRKSAIWRKMGKKPLPLIPLCPRRWPDERTHAAPVRTYEHLQRRVIGLGGLWLALPLRDSAGLVHTNVTGLPPLCAAHPGVGRTSAEWNSIVPASIRQPDLICQPKEIAPGEAQNGGTNPYAPANNQLIPTPRSNWPLATGNYPLSTALGRSGRSGPPLCGGTPPATPPCSYATVCAPCLLVRQPPGGNATLRVHRQLTPRSTRPHRPILFLSTGQ